MPVIFKKSPGTWSIIIKKVRQGYQSASKKFIKAHDILFKNSTGCTIQEVSPPRRRCKNVYNQPICKNNRLKRHF
jgi:hypothetical protein